MVLMRMFFVHKLELVVLLMANQSHAMKKKPNLRKIKSANYKVEKKAETKKLTSSTSLPPRRAASKRKSASCY